MYEGLIEYFARCLGVTLDYRVLENTGLDDWEDKNLISDDTYFNCVDGEEGDNGKIYYFAKHLENKPLIAVLNNYGGDDYDWEVTKQGYSILHELIINAIVHNTYESGKDYIDIIKPDTLNAYKFKILAISDENKAIKQTIANIENRNAIRLQQFKELGVYELMDEYGLTLMDVERLFNLTIEDIKDVDFDSDNFRAMVQAKVNRIKND